MRRLRCCCHWILFVRSGVIFGQVDVLRRQCMEAQESLQRSKNKNKRLWEEERKGREMTESIKKFDETSLLGVDRNRHV